MDSRKQCLLIMLYVCFPSLQQSQLGTRPGRPARGDPPGETRPGGPARGDPPGTALCDGVGVPESLSDGIHICLTFSRQRHLDVCPRARACARACACACDMYQQALRKQLRHRLQLQQKQNPFFLCPFENTQRSTTKEHTETH